MSSAPGEPLVSVVTPFYNTDDYLAECIESVLAQTFGDFEYLLVNNKSTDRSVEIAERYAARDPRIRLLHNDTFLSQIQNYNGALRRISPATRYVKVVQADDSIFPRCLEDMVRLAEANPQVGVVSALRRINANVGPSGVPHHRTVLSGRDACRLALIDDLFLFGSQTTTMLRADIVRRRDPFYDEASKFPDSDVIYDLLHEHDFGFVHQVLTFSRVETGSISGKMKSWQPLYLDRLLRLRNHGPFCLEPAELERLTREHEAIYSRFLGSAWLRRREPAFWEFHRDGIELLGLSPRHPRIWLEGLASAAGLMLRPFEVVRALRKKVAPKG